MPRTTELSKPQALLGQPQPPADLSIAGKSMWRLIVASRPAVAWTQADAMLIAMYVRAALDVQRLDAEITMHGEVEDGKVSPRVKLRAMREQVLLTLAHRLKLSPSARYTAKDAGRLHGHAKRAGAALSTLDDDDELLLARHDARLQ